MGGSSRRSPRATGHVGSRSWSGTQLPPECTCSSSLSSPGERGRQPTPRLAGAVPQSTILQPRREPKPLIRHTQVAWGQPSWSRVLAPEDWLSSPLAP